MLHAPRFGLWVPVPLATSDPDPVVRHRLAGRGLSVIPDGAGRFLIEEEDDIAVRIDHRVRDGRIELRMRRAKGNWALAVGIFDLVLGLLAYAWDENRRRQLADSVWEALHHVPEGARRR